MKTLSAHNQTATDSPHADMIRLIKIEFDGLTLRGCSRVFGDEGARNIFDGEVWEPFVISWGTIKSGRIDPVTHETAAGFASCVVDNNIPLGGADRFAELFATYDPNYTTVTISDIFEGASDSGDMIDRFKGTIEDPVAMVEPELTLTFTGPELDIAGKFTHEIVTPADFPNADANHIGKMLPQVYGSAKRVPLIGLEVGTVTTLVADIDDSQTDEIYLAEAENFTVPFTIMIGSEKIRVTEFNSTTGEVTICEREYDGSSAAAHSAQAKVEEIPDRIVYGIGHAIKAWNHIYTVERSSGLLLRQPSGNYRAYTGQSGDRHASFGSRAVVQFDQAGTIPSGAIVAYKGGAAPSGWALFSSADGRFIVGAGNTYSAGDTGGSVSCSGYLTWDTHSGTYFDGINAQSFPGAYNVMNGTPAAENHFHEIDFDYEPEYQELKLIKATGDKSEFPADSVVFSAGENPDPATLSAVYEGNRFFKADSSVGTGGGSESAVDISQSYDHAHISYGAGVYDDTGSDTAYEYEVDGDHTHNDTMDSFVPDADIRRAYIKAWTDTGAFKAYQGTICMWESATPPDGWELCTELEDYFIVLSDDTNAGTYNGGSGKLKFDGSTLTDEDGEHSHQGDPVNDYGDSFYREAPHTTAGAHQHEIRDDIDYTPPYYALVFIRKKTETIVEDVQGTAICADMDGHQDDGSGTYTGTPSALIERPDHISKHILLNRCGQAAGVIGSSYTAAGTFLAAQGYILAPVLLERPNVRNFLNRIAKQSGCLECWEAGAHQIIPIEDGPAYKVITQNRMDARQLRLKFTDRAAIKNSLTARYSRHWSGHTSDIEADQNVASDSASASIVKYGTLTGTQRSYPYVTDDDQAEALLALDLAENATPRIIAEFSGGFYLSDIERGDILRLRIGNSATLGQANIFNITAEDGTPILTENYQFIETAAKKFLVIDTLYRPDRAIQVEGIELRT